MLCPSPSLESRRRVAALPDIIGCVAAWGGRRRDNSSLRYGRNCFTYALGRGNAVPVLINHWPQMRVASRCRLWQDTVGLWARIQLDDCLVSRLLVSAMSDGTYHEMSCSTRSCFTDVAGHRIIDDVFELSEVSIVWEALSEGTTARLCRPYFGHVISDAAGILNAKSCEFAKCPTD